MRIETAVLVIALPKDTFKAGWKGALNGAQYAIDAFSTKDSQGNPMPLPMPTYPIVVGSATLGALYGVTTHVASAVRELFR